jgi:Flp pilus assembly protein TadD
VLFAVGASGLMLALVWRLRRVERIASFGIVWFLLLLVPSAALNVLDQGEPMAEHRVYLASCGVFLAAGTGVGRLGAWLARARARTRWLGRAALAAVLVSFSVETLFRNSVWADPVTLWRESVELAPTHFRPRLLLGEALQDVGRREEAIEQYTIALRLRPTELTGYLKLGLCLAEMGRLDEARHYLRQAIAVDPQNEPARRSLALLDMIRPAK